ncbi:AAA family ATPase [Hydrogenimonas urashimensis]|uniref:AAA family ATPase n=1 Tax=Hydrogenimonas urashimensis TaxID=2740515 RepID=UPI0019153F4E|nr:AAA family ATPase [Hydrogenimonas urashimensis]
MSSVNSFERYAKKEIVGQERAIAFLSLAVERVGRVRLFDGVEGAIALAGPPACGKNFAAVIVGRYLQRETLILHMGEYAYADDIERLVGKHGVLERWINEHPNGVVVFEEIEKADHSIQRAIAAIVSDGAPDDQRRYRQALFLFTFTLGDPSWYERSFVDAFYDNPLLRQGKFYEDISKVAAPDEVGNMVALFDAELLNVLSEGDLTLFYLLDLKALWSITERIMNRTVAQLNSVSLTEIEIRDPKEVALALLLGFSPYLNAKRIAHKLPALLTDRLSLQCQRAGKCIIALSPKARRWLSGFFDLSFDLKYFIKFERHFELTWKTREGKRETTLLIDALKEIEPQRPEQRSAYADRLSIRASHIGFGDVAGQIRVKKELRSIIKVLQNEKGLKHFRITLPKGLLLYGPEGVGKTMLVKAFAKEAGLPYIYLRSVDLFDEVLIQEVYSRARIAAPVIVVLEGVDTKGVIEGNYTHIPTGTLCDMIDRAPAEPDNYIFTIATARDLQEVPEDLTHPGRIDQSVEVPELDREARRFFAEKILEKPHEEGIDIDRITRYMSGMNGYELERIAKEAALDALRAGKEKLSEEIVIDRINTIKYGHKLEKKRFKNFEEDLKKSAWHEAAHAVASLRLLPDVEIEQVTVIPRSEALGLVSYMEDAIETNMSKEEIEANIAVLLAGRLATIKKFGKEKGLETGAYNDLQEASLYAYSAVAQFGMDEELFNLHVEILLQNVSHTLFKETIESRVRAWIDKGTKRAEEIVETEWKTIERIAKKLLKEEVIEGDQLKKLVLG